MKKRVSTLVLITTMLGSSQVIAGHTNTLLEAELDGREEVGSDPTVRLVGDPDGKGEAYVFGIDGDPTTLCYTLTVEKIALVPVGSGMAAHIHEGLRDTNGPVVAVLAGPEDGNAADCLTEGETGKFPTGESGIVQRILDNPAQFYINVHNPDFPSGAIRGNLSSQLHDHEHEHADAGSPSSPMNITVAVYSATAIELFWDRSTDDGFVTAYQIYRDNVALTMSEGNSFYDDSLTPGTEYEYSVSAIDNDGNLSSRSASVNVTTN